MLALQSFADIIHNNLSRKLKKYEKICLFNSFYRAFIIFGFC